MYLVLTQCGKCGILKEFWLRDIREEAFFCKCSYKHTMMRNYHSSSFRECFEYDICEANDIDHAIKMSLDYQLRINEVALRSSLQAFNFPVTSLQESCDIVQIISENLDYDYFRKLLMEFNETEALLAFIAKHNARIDIPNLRAYLSEATLPLSMKDILTMEEAIASQFYHPDIFYEA